MKNNPIEKIRDLLAEPEARRKAAICAGLAAALAVGGAGIAIASNRPEPIDSTPSAVEKAGAESVAPPTSPRYARRSRSTGRTSAPPPTRSPSRPARAASS
ncbi:MAG: hypothetical protein ACLUYK_00500 [Eggerthella lenta]